MRPSCLFCARKHLAQASILMTEARMGYPEHVWLAIGHMAEAADELISTYPEMANDIRTFRKLYEEDHRRVIPIMALIKKVGELPTSWTPFVEVPLVEVPHAPPNWSPIGEVPGAPQAQAAAPKPSYEVGEFKGLSGNIAVAQGAGASTLLADSTHTRVGRGDATPCVGCVERAEKERLALFAQKLASTPDMPLVVLMTTLSNFSPSYSLTSVILEQAHAAAITGYRVAIMVQRGCDLKELPPLPPEIDVLPLVPLCSWKEDVIVEEDVTKLVAAMRQWFDTFAATSTRPAHIITHDLLFQSWFVSFAKAIHLVRHGINELRWYHMAHSSVGARPTSTVHKSGGGLPTEVFPIFYRCTLPKDHHLIVLNYADVPAFKGYYRTGDDAHGLDVVPVSDDHVHTLLNSKDVRPFYRMTMNAAVLTTKYALHRADVTMMYPLSLTRIQEKGIHHVLSLLGAFKRLGLTVRLLIATAHANGGNAPQLLTWVREQAAANGLVCEGQMDPPDVIISAEAIPATASAGLSADDIRSLWPVTNLFIFPTISEAGSLVLMEAALAGCRLVLNKSLPCLQDYIPLNLADWVSWGSLKSSADSFDHAALDQIAEKVWGAMQQDNRSVLKRRIMEQHCLETYGTNLAAILRWPRETAPFQGQEASGHWTDDTVMLQNRPRNADDMGMPP